MENDVTFEETGFAEAGDSRKIQMFYDVTEFLRLSGESMLPPKSNEQLLKTC